MKKWIAALLVALVFITCTACGKNTPEDAAATGEETSYDGISIQVLDAEKRGEETVLTVQWQNQTEHSVMYGEAFALQRWDTDRWVDCEANENTAFHTVGYLLKSGKTVIKSYQTQWLYGKLEPGSYRFVSGCRVLLDGESVSCKVSCEFTLEENDAERTFNTPPELWINHTGKETAAKGTYSWNYALEDGMWSCVNADASHPLLMRDNLNLISSGDAAVVLEFEDWPDDYTVRCWPAAADMNDESEAAMVWNNSVELKRGDYIYEVTAIWNDDGGSYHGTVTYVFYAAPSGPYDVMPIKN